MFLEYYSQLNHSEVMRMSHQPEQMFRKCVFETSYGDQVIEILHNRNAPLIFTITLAELYDNDLLLEIYH